MSREIGPWYTPLRKLRLDKPIYWENHYDGWKRVWELLKDNTHTSEGIRFVSSVEDEFYEDHEHYTGGIREPWVGFIHQIPHHSLKFPDLERLLKLEIWKESVEYCKGLWTLTDYQKIFLLEHNVSVPVAKVFYPSAMPTKTFSFERFMRNPSKKVAYIGEFMRNFQAIFDLQVDEYNKIILRSPEIDILMKKQGVIENNSVKSLARISNQQYDNLLSENIVFLQLLDAGAVTTVIECIVRGTPIVINKVGGVPEYLGAEYPLYYETIEEANDKISNVQLIEEAAAYLRDLEIKKQLSCNHFIHSIQNTAIYRSLPIPSKQKKLFNKYDLSVVICSYKRVYNINGLLERLVEQDFDGSFEIIIWNNNIEVSDELDKIKKRFVGQLDIKVIHSTENYFCQIRFAIANLIRSDIVMICDDDVLPGAGYLSRFMAKYKEYGPDAVICARGHIFDQHQLNEENPENFWNHYDDMRFFNEETQDRPIHFLHADNCLIPKHILKQSSIYEMPEYDYILVDDYWLSYILSAKLNIPIWKIRADDVLSFTECANNTSIAMYHNPLVHEQRINFYIHHMRQGWPTRNDAVYKFNMISDLPPERNASEQEL